jgi:transcriptional regulator with GAF, ATPase, and Fis domain
VATANRGLTQLVQEGRFRSDLYYRLNTFPILLPPLRQRREDIPAFVHRAARKMGKDVCVVPEDVQETLVQHDWPGNIRELQNFIERAVILSTGPTLCVPPRAVGHSMRAEQVATVTPDDLQRGHILKTLEEASWVVGGRRSAVRTAPRRGTEEFVMMPEPFVSTKEAAKFIGISRRFLTEFARRGIAGAYRIWTGELRETWVFRLQNSPPQSIAGAAAASGKRAGVSSNH